MITSRRFDVQFHYDNAAGAQDRREDVKGKEADMVAGANLPNRYAFTGTERAGAVFAYDVTDPMAPRFVRHVTSHRPNILPVDDESGELDLESVIFLNANESPLAGNAPMRIVGSEILGTLAVFSVSAQ